MFWVDYIGLLIILLAGVVLTAMTLPGTWLMVLAYIGYWVLTLSAGFIGWESVILLFALATIAEIIDTFASGAGAKKAGASRRAMFGAVIGGILGAIFLTFLIPIPVLGTIIGACAGCFIGAGVVEMLVRKDVGQSVRVGLHAAKGRLVGIIGKLVFAFVMLMIAAGTALPIHAKIPAPTPPLRTLPTTVPAQ